MGCSFSIASLPCLRLINFGIKPASNGPGRYKASTEESRWLAHIGANLKDAEAKEYWGVLVKHFDGKRAMEEIGAREGLKRSKVQALLQKLEGEGVVHVVRHW